MSTTPGRHLADQRATPDEPRRKCPTLVVTLNDVVTGSFDGG